MTGASTKAINGLIKYRVQTVLQVKWRGTHPLTRNKHFLTMRVLLSKVRKFFGHSRKYRLDNRKNKILSLQWLLRDLTLNRLIVWITLWLIIAQVLYGLSVRQTKTNPVKSFIKFPLCHLRLTSELCFQIKLLRVGWQRSTESQLRTRSLLGTTI
jgi:hypothetical protein